MAMLVATISAQFKKNTDMAKRRIDVHAECYQERRAGDGHVAKGIERRGNELQSGFLRGWGSLSSLVGEDTY
jgi:hypothetical protein